MIPKEGGSEDDGEDGELYETKVMLTATLSCKSINH